MQRQIERLTELQEDVLNHCSKYEKIKSKEEALPALEKLEAFVSTMSAAIDAAKAIIKKSKQYLDALS